MPVRVSSLLPVLLLLCCSPLDAQPLHLGSTRAEVMQQVYRTGSFADTLKEGSFLINQLQRKPRKGARERFDEAIRVAPARLFDIDGYGQFIFDNNGRLVHYCWMRQDMTKWALGAAWTRFVDWRSDVSPDTYRRANNQLLAAKPVTLLTKASNGIHATLWKDSVETMMLSWESGALMFIHHSIW